MVWTRLVRWGWLKKYVFLDCKIKNSSHKTGGFYIWYQRYLISKFQFQKCDLRLKFIPSWIGGGRTIFIFVVGIWTFIIIWCLDIIFIRGSVIRYQTEAKIKKQQLLRVRPYINHTIEHCMFSPGCLLLAFDTITCLVGTLQHKINKTLINREQNSHFQRL